MQVAQTRSRVVQKMNGLLSDIRQSYNFSQFTMPNFVRWVEAQRGRPIHFQSWPMPPTLFGLWLKSADTDFIFYQRDTLALHQVHIQLHELAHLLCGHETLQVCPENLPAILCQILSGEGLRMRSYHTDAVEAEAEMLSALLREEIYQQHRLAQLTHPFIADKEAQQMHRALGFLS